MAGRSQSSWVWKDKGGYIVKTGVGKAQCTQIIDCEDGMWPCSGNQYWPYGKPP